jgi:hypothetical protein
MADVADRLNRFALNNLPLRGAARTFTDFLIGELRHAAAFMLTVEPLAAK